MEYFDLEELFMQSVKEIVLNDKEKYKNIKDIEKNLMQMYLDWTMRSNSVLDGFTPIEYVAFLDKSGNLFDYIEYMLNTGREVSDIVTDKLLARSDASEFVKRLLNSNEQNTMKYAFTVLFELGGEELRDACIELIANGEKNQDKLAACYEFLSEAGEDTTDKILALMYQVDEEAQMLFADILSNYRNNENIFMWLVTLLYRGDDICQTAAMLGRYGDKKAVDLINSYVTDKDLNYNEFIELRNAVERLGGEFLYEKDFSGDKYYRLIVEKNNKENENDNA